MSKAKIVLVAGAWISSLVSAICILIRKKDTTNDRLIGCSTVLFVFILAVLLLGLLVNGLSSIFTLGNTLGNESEIKELVRSNLKDPSSAQFKDAVVCANDTRASIVWNAKNSMGGYGDWDVAELVKIDSKWTVVTLKGDPNYCEEYSLKNPEILKVVSKELEHPESNEFSNTYIFPDGGRACVTWGSNGSAFTAIVKKQNSEWVLETLYGGSPGDCSVRGLPQLEAEAKFNAAHKSLFDDVDQSATAKAFEMLMRAKNISTEEASASSDWRIGCMSLIEDFAFKSRWAVELPLRMREDEMRKDGKIKLLWEDPLKSIEQNEKDLQIVKSRLEKGQCEEPVEVPAS